MLIKNEFQNKYNNAFILRNQRPLLFQISAPAPEYEDLIWFFYIYFVTFSSLMSWEDKSTSLEE